MALLVSLLLWIGSELAPEYFGLAEDLPNQQIHAPIQCPSDWGRGGGNLPLQPWHMTPERIHGGIE